jgi:glycine cleavage system H lipoate-binding protein
MEELLKKLLAAEVLTEETKQELEAAFKKHLEDAEKKAREEATAGVTAALNEQWITERETLIEALDEKVSEVLTEELKELKEDIERFRDLEAEYAEKIVESKGEMADQLKKDMELLIEKLDKFLEIRLTAEVEELRGDVEIVKKNEFGKKVFEAFVAEFKKHYTGEDSVEGKLTETQQRLEDALTSLEDAEKKIAKMERSKKLQDVLAPVTGRTREVMEAILKNVDTPLLEEAYKTYIGRVVKETSEKKEEVKEISTSEKETKVLAEGEKKEEAKTAPASKPTLTGKAVSGDTKDILEEGKKLDKETEVKSAISDEEKARLRRLAGLA